MPKSAWKIVILGAKSVGKTSLVEQIVYGIYQPGKTYPTVEDTYDAWIETDKSQKERIRIFDTAGMNLEAPKVTSHHLHIADGFLLVFSVCSEKSFKLVDDLKREIERVRGKDFPMVVLGTKIDKPEDRTCEHTSVVKWAEAEKVKLFEVLVSSRRTLQEPVTCLAKKMTSSSGKSSGQNVNRFFQRRGATRRDAGNDS